MLLPYPLASRKDLNKPQAGVLSLLAMHFGADIKISLWIGWLAGSTLALCAAEPKAARVPEIWFAPDDPIHQEHHSEPGVIDFMDLFPAGAPWSQAAAHIQIFQIYPQFASRATDEQLRTVIEGLRQRHIALALSCGMLHLPPGGKWHEGYGAETAPRLLARIKRLGGDVRWAIADEPLWFGHFYRAPGAIPVSIAEMAQDMATTAQAFRSVFPDIHIGMEEPIMAYTSQTQWSTAMRELLSEFHRTFGEPMGCVRLENANHSIREWLPRFVDAARFLEQLHIPFGILVTGDTDDVTDADWFRKAEERYVAFESEGRRAAQMVFQSWMPRPSRILPDTAPLTHTHSLNDYFRNRTVLAATCEFGRLGGRLTNEDGRPIPDAQVELAVLPAFVDPEVVHRTIKGMVPTGAKTAQVGVRIGIEGSCAGLSRFSLGNVRYTEPAEAAHAAVFPFEHGLKVWGVQGDASAHVDDSNQVLNVIATPDHTLLLNSRAIPVTAGHEFTLNLDLHLQHDTETGYFVVFFFNDAKKVLLRVQEPLVPEKLRTIKKLITDAAGQFATSATTPELQQAREIHLTYAGDTQRRPAMQIIPYTPGNPRP